MLLSTILIAAPLGILALVGLVYIVAPRHLSYHRTVIAKLGEPMLVGKLVELSIVCGMGAGYVDVVIMKMKPTAIIFPHVILTLAGMVGVFSASASDRALVIRRCAGLLILLFCAAELLLIAAASRTSVSVAGVVATTLLAFVTIGTRALGRKSGAKTPWPLLAALCVPLIIGTTLAFLA